MNDTATSITPKRKRDDDDDNDKSSPSFTEIVSNVGSAIINSLFKRRKTEIPVNDTADANDTNTRSRTADVTTFLSPSISSSDHRDSSQNNNMATGLTPKQPDNSSPVAFSFLSPTTNDNSISSSANKKKNVKLAPLLRKSTPSATATALKLKGMSPYKSDYGLATSTSTTTPTASKATTTTTATIIARTTTTRASLNVHIVDLGINDNFRTVGSRHTLIELRVF